MRTIVKGKNLEVADRTRRYAERKLGRIERLLDDRSDALVELSVERHRSLEDSAIVEVTLVIDGQPIRGHAEARTHEAAIDDVIDKIERRAVDHKEKPRLRARPDEEKAILRRIADGSADGGPNGDTDGGRDARIVKVKRFDIEPMFEEDALSRMDELGHAFFVFVNAESERVNILYRRTDGNVGLIEPIVGGAYTPLAGSDRNRRHG